MSKGIFVFDLDHTLYNTTAFKRNMFRSLKKFGIPELAVEKAYKDFMHRSGSFNHDYSMRGHLKFLRKDYKFPMRGAEQEMNKVFSQAKKYIFPGAERTLNILKSKGYALILLTRGNRNFNQRKIFKSGLNKFFNTIVATPQEKPDVLSRLIPKDFTGQLCFVNDNFTELLAIQKKFRKSMGFLKIENGRKIGKKDPKTLAISAISGILLFKP